MAVTSYGRNKNHDDEIKKNQEKANNSLSYRCAAINNQRDYLDLKFLFVRLSFDHASWVMAMTHPLMGIDVKLPQLNMISTYPLKYDKT